jgi:hypothetical protein
MLGSNDTGVPKTLELFRLGRAISGDVVQDVKSRSVDESHLRCQEVPSEPTGCAVSVFLVVSDPITIARAR